jgi:hypothetical protein
MDVAHCRSIHNVFHIDIDLANFPDLNSYSATLAVASSVRTTRGTASSPDATRLVLNSEF